MFYSRKKLRESIKYALDSKGYICPVAGPASLILSTIYLPFAVVAVPFNIYWFFKFKSFDFIKLYNLLAVLNIWASAKAVTWALVSLLIAAATVIHYFSEDQIIAGIIALQVIVVAAMYLQANWVLSNSKLSLK